MGRTVIVRKDYMKDILCVIRLRDALRIDPYPTSAHPYTINLLDQTITECIKLNEQRNTQNVRLKKTG